MSKKIPGYGGRGIEDMLNLPYLEDILAEQNEEVSQDSEVEEIVTNVLVEPDVSAPAVASSMIETFEDNIKMIGGESHAKNLEIIAKETLEHSRTLMDMAYNVDDRSRRGILEIAASMYKNTIDANNSKRDYELKLLKLLQDQRKLDLDERKWRAERGEDDSSPTISGPAIMADRNELIAKALADRKK